MKQTHMKGIFEVRKRRRSLFTVNMNPGKVVYGEKSVRERGVEYREWDAARSKLAACILNGVDNIDLKEGDYVLYLGCSTGTTVSHVSDIVGDKGVIYAVDLAPRVMRELIFLAEDRKNIIPLLADANHPWKVLPFVSQVDFLYQDIAQKNQVDIFLKNLIFLKKGGQAVLCVKARSIDTTRRPKSIFNEVREQLKKSLKIIDLKTLEPYQKDHCVFICQY